MQVRSKLLRGLGDAADTTLKKIYDVYMRPDGHFAAGEPEDAEPRNGTDRKPSTSLAHKMCIF